MNVANQGAISNRPIDHYVAANSPEQEGHRPVPAVPRVPHPYVRGELVIVIDCASLERSAIFWTEVLGYVTAGPSAGPYQSLVPAAGAGIEILLQRVSERKGSKNRLHLDLRTPSLESEVERVRRAGAILLTDVDQPVVEAGWRWHVLADPDGNEFCVLEPPASHWQGLPW